MVIRRLLPSSVAAGPAPPPLSSPLTLSCPRPPPAYGSGDFIMPRAGQPPLPAVGAASCVRPQRGRPRGQSASAPRLPGSAGRARRRCGGWSTAPLPGGGGAPPHLGRAAGSSPEAALSSRVPCGAGGEEKPER